MTHAHPTETAIDWPALTARLGGEAAILGELLRVVVRTNAAVPAALRQAAQTDEMGVIEKLAHRTKGMAGDLVAHTCHVLAHDTELAARAHAPSAAGLSLQLADALDALLDEARAHLAA